MKTNIAKTGWMFGLIAVLLLSVSGRPAFANGHLLVLDVVADPGSLDVIESATFPGQGPFYVGGVLILLNLWATWCGPCREEMPALDRLQAQLGGDEFMVLALAINVDGLAAVKDFFRLLELKTLSVFVDTAGEATDRLQVNGVPTTLLIDRQGREIGRKMGLADWAGDEAVALIQSYLAAE